MKQQFEVKYSESNTPYIVGIQPLNHFSNDDVNYLISIGNPGKVFIEMVHSNGDFDYPKKYIPKLQNSCVILIRDEVEKPLVRTIKAMIEHEKNSINKIITTNKIISMLTKPISGAIYKSYGSNNDSMGEMIDEKAMYKSEFNETETSLSLEFKIWSLAYENNSEENYRSVIAEVEKLQPKIIEQSDVDKVEIRVIATLEASVSDLENRLYKASVDNAKLMAKLQQSHPPVTSMSAEEFMSVRGYSGSVYSVFITLMDSFGEYVLANSGRWSDEDMYEVWREHYGDAYPDKFEDFLTQYKQK